MACKISFFDIFWRHIANTLHIVICIHKMVYILSFVVLVFRWCIYLYSFYIILSHPKILEVYMAVLTSMNITYQFVWRYDLKFFVINSIYEFLQVTFQFNALFRLYFSCNIFIPGISDFLF